MTQLRSPVGVAMEHDAVQAYLDQHLRNSGPAQPAATESVNTAIGAFALSFPLQSPKVQSSVLEQLSSFIDSSTTQKEPARRAAVTVNIAAAMSLTAKILHGQTAALSGTFHGASAEKAFQNIVHVRAVISPHVIGTNPYTRH